MRVSTFEGLTDADVVTYFHNARRPEYEEVAGRLDDLIATLPEGASREERLEARDGLERLRKRYAEVSKRDFFRTAEGGAVAAKLAQLSTRLSTGDTPAEAVEPVSPADFTGKVWVTRPRPFVDRLASVWLIRRFVDAGAVVRYRDLPEAGEVAFDLPDARFNHIGNLCTFEVLVAAFGLDAPGLRELAEVVHELDLQDGRYGRPEAAGLEAVLSGWQRLPLSDGELEVRGVALFEGLYRSLAAAEAAPLPTDTQATKEHTRGHNR